MTDPMKATEYAHALYRAHGDRAEAEAARRALLDEEKGDTAGAQSWRKVQSAIRQLRGPLQQ